MKASEGSWRQWQRSLALTVPAVVGNGCGSSSVKNHAIVSGINRNLADKYCYARFHGSGHFLGDIAQSG